MKRLVLIDGSFELLNYPDHIEVYDIRPPKKGGSGDEKPIETVSLRGPVSDRDAGRLALAWLLAYRHLNQGDYLRYLDLFLASQPDASVPVMDKSKKT